MIQMALSFVLAMVTKALNSINLSESSQVYSKVQENCWYRDSYGIAAPKYTATRESCMLIGKRKKMGLNKSKPSLGISVQKEWKTKV